MLEEVKEQLLEKPEAIRNILEHFGFANISVRSQEIRCGFDEQHNPNSIRIRLQNNPDLFVKDYGRDFTYDLFNYIIRAKDEQFKTVINVVKQELGIENIFNYKRKVGPFRGIYDHVCRHSSETELKALDESILGEYLPMGNKTWLKDGISLATQRKFQVGYSVVDQRIIFPIRAYDGTLVAVKGRANWDISETPEVPKYLFLHPGLMSNCLYGFYTNYNSLYESDIVIFESEKSVMVLDSMGDNNGVALGSNSLSSAQCKLLLSLNPKSVTFMLDNSLSLDVTKKNVEMLRSFCRMRELPIYFFNWTDSLSLSEKAAPVDEGKEVYEYILANEIESADVLFTSKNAVEEDYEEEI